MSTRYIVLKFDNRDGNAFDSTEVFGPYKSQSRAFQVARDDITADLESSLDSELIDEDEFSERVTEIEFEPHGYGEWGYYSGDASYRIHELIDIDD